MGDTHANAQKADTDAKAAELLDIDQKELAKASKTIAGILEHLEVPKMKIVITGAAGSGKTTLAGELSKKLEVPVFDLDEFIEGGWTSDKEEYKKRFVKALYQVWQKLPANGSWIIDHVEACNSDILRILRPNFLILVHPPDSRIVATAKARMVVSSDKSDRIPRAMQSKKTAEKQFKDAGGMLLRKEKGWTLKRSPPQTKG
jgi:hypothetical protein